MFKCWLLHKNVDKKIRGEWKLNKYPFSKKALNVMLAATVALSPVITTSVVFQPTNVEAATVSQEIEALSERFFVFYQHSGKYGFAGTPTAAINSLTYAQIQETATAKGISLNVPAAKQADFENLMKNTAKLIYTQYGSAADLATAVKAFKTANSGYFNNLFDEDGNVFADQLILFVKDLEGELERGIAGANAPTFAAVISAAVQSTFDNGANKARYANLDGKLGNVGLSVEGLFLLQEELNNKFVDPNKSLRSALMQSAFQEKGARIERNTSNNQFTLWVPVKFINDFIEVPLRGSIHWQTSNPSVATFSGNTLTGISTGTVNVYATIDGIKLATFENVNFNFSTGGGGGGNPIDPINPGDDNDHLPEGTIEIIRTPLPGNKVEIVTKVPDDKVDELVNTITNTNSTLQINLGNPAANEELKASLPAALFTEIVKKYTESVVEIGTEEASYKLPAKQIDVEKLAAKLGVPAASVQITVSADVVERPENINGIKFVSKVAEFKVEAVSGDKKVLINTFTEYVTPAALFTEIYKEIPNAVFEVKTEEASYKLPASQINVEGLAKRLGVPAANVQIAVSVNVFELVEFSNGIKVVSKVVEYTVEAVSGDKRESINTFTEYVSRTIQGDQTFDPNKSTGVKVNPDGSVTPVPTTFDGKTATFNSLTNSLYTVVENDITFSDVNKPWHEKEYIETLANKLIIQGKTDSQGKPDGTFAPGEDMTRAQFTTMLVKALALPSKKSSKKSFSDVKETDWFKDALDTAYEYNIISGKPDGRFAPNEPVTRSQVAIMLHRTMELGFINDMTKVNTDKKEFSDVEKLDAKTKEAIDALYQAGIIQGKPDGTFDPNGKTLRNHMAKMLAEFLISAKLMNKIK